jgi:D-aminopeptidase
VKLAGQAASISGSHKPSYMMRGLDDSFDAVMFISYRGPDRLATYRASCAAILLTRSIAEAA